MHLLMGAPVCWCVCRFHHQLRETFGQTDFRVIAILLESQRAREISAPQLRNLLKKPPKQTNLHLENRNPGFTDRALFQANVETFFLFLSALWSVSLWIYLLRMDVTWTPATTSHHPLT